MFDRVLKRLRERVQQRAYVMTIHAEEEMDADGLTIFDVEGAILTGRITERQRDGRTREWKYVVSGNGIGGDGVGVVCKLGPTDRLVVLTTYRE